MIVSVFARQHNTLMQLNWGQQEWINPPYLHLRCVFGGENMLKYKTNRR